MSEGESVKVAVRCRPFNSREKERNAKLIIEMTGALTMITNPADGDVKKFTFDFSYWSHNGFAEQENGYLEKDGGSNYATQRMVFDDLGQGVLNNAFEGFNCSLFAYGQTGAGKSYSMVGYGNNKGIVPITCDELFKSIESNTDTSKRFEVTFSMLEIYNEQVRDLLSNEQLKGGLPVRQHPKLGFYVDGLKKTPVGSYAEIEKRTEQGTNNRTVAATQMNATSSRAHTVVTITFDQIIKNDSGETKKSSTMNLVDLAGSERADSTGATGDRLKEGANINKSLSALGNVISALADQSMGKKKVMVPYRDSVLTKLLQNALGGNSKTIMIAALSPADINYDETLSTLRYADRAKKIKNKAVINENPLDKLIRELREENERLKASMSGEMPLLSNTQGMSPEEVEKMRKEMEEEIRAQMMANMQMLEANDSSHFQERLNVAREEIQNEAPREDTRKTSIPHFVNLNEDAMLSGVIFHFLENDETTIGRADADPPPTIGFKGLSISKEHAIVTKAENNVVEMKPGSPGAKTKVNGMPLTGTRDLQHKDRVLFGSNHLYVFMNPLNTECGENVPETVDWDFAQKEIAEAKGFNTAGGSGLSQDQQVAQEQILEILPMVTEVNAISEELDKRRSFEVVLLSAAAQEGAYGEDRGTKVMVKMRDLLSDNTWLWERGKFINRRFLMQDMYQKHLDGEDVKQIPKEEDPFWEAPEDLLIGTTNVFLQALGYCLDFDDKLTVTDYKGVEEGFLYVTVLPCTEKGKALDEDNFVDEPQELLDKPYSFKVTIRRLEVMKARFNKGLKVRYLVYKDEEATETPVIKGTLEPEFKHSKIFTFDKITPDHLEFFENGSITFSIYACQEEGQVDPSFSKMSTKELNEMNASSPSKENVPIQIQPKADNPAEVGRIKSELATMQRKNERLEDKEKRLRALLEEWGNKKPEDRDMDTFYRAVNSIARSSANKFKTQAEVITKLLRAKRLGRVGFQPSSEKKKSIDKGKKEENPADKKKNSIVPENKDEKKDAEKKEKKDKKEEKKDEKKEEKISDMKKDEKAEIKNNKGGKEGKGSSTCQLL